MDRRELLRLGVGSLAAGLSVPCVARAAGWPTKAIRAVVPYAAGSATDLVPRTVSGPRFRQRHAARQCAAGAGDRAIKAKLTKLVVEPMITSAKDFDARIAKEAVIAKELATAAKIQPQ